MQAISVHQPWAGWIAKGLKTIETRKHARFKSLVGKRIAIHATKKWDNHATRESQRYRDEKRDKIGCHDLLNRTYLPGVQGCIICTAFVKEHRLLKAGDSLDALIDCTYSHLYGLILEDIKPLTFTIPWKGQQGIFHVPDELLQDET